MQYRLDSFHFGFVSFGLSKGPRCQLLCGAGAADAAVGAGGGWAVTPIIGRLSHHPLRRGFARYQQRWLSQQPTQCQLPLVQFHIIFEFLSAHSAASQLSDRTDLLQVLTSFNYGWPSDNNEYFYVPVGAHYTVRTAGQNMKRGTVESVRNVHF